MILIKLDSLDTVNALTNVCNKYKDKMSIDVLYGRYIVDACSVLGVSSLIGNIVKVDPVIADSSVIDVFVDDMKRIGAWTENN